MENLDKKVDNQIRSLQLTSALYIGIAAYYGYCIYARWVKDKFRNRLKQRYETCDINGTIIS